MEHGTKMEHGTGMTILCKIFGSNLMINLIVWKKDRQ